MCDQVGWGNNVLAPSPRTIDSMLTELDRVLNEKAAVKDGGQELTYGELHRYSLRMAHALKEKGTRPGDVILLDLSVGIPLLVSFLAVTRMGAIALHVHRLLKQDEITWLMHLSKPCLAIGGDFHLTNLPTFSWEDLNLSSLPKEVLSPPMESDTAMLRITSGTTGRPKVIQVSQRQLCRRIANPGVHYRSDDVYGCPSPYAFPCYHIVTALGSGGKVVFRHAATQWQIERMIEEDQISCFWGVPSMYEQVAMAGSPAVEFSSLRSAISSGAYLSEKTARAVMKRWKTPLYQFYGQSELGFLTESGPDTPTGSVGKSVYGVQIRIGDSEGKHTSDNMRGRVQVQTETGFPPYLSGEQLPIDEEGWWTTGDLGYLDQNGNLFLTGRESELIHVGGFKVDPLEVADIIREFDGVKDAYVFSRPHPLRGEMVAAAVETDGLLTPGEIRKLCHRKLPRHKCPRKVFMISKLPRNPLGKINRLELLNLLNLRD